MLNIFGIRPRNISSLELTKRIQSEQSSIIHCIDAPLLVESHYNLWLKHSVNSGNYSLFTNFVNSWALKRIHSQTLLPEIYNRVAHLHFLLRAPLYVLFYSLQVIANLFDYGLTLLLGKQDSVKKTSSFFDIEQLLYKSMRIGSQQSWNVMIAGHNRNSLSVARSFITNLYPDLTLNEWYPHSLVLSDQVFDQDHTIHSDSWLEFQPAWKSLVDTIKNVDFLIYQAQGNEGPIVMDMLAKHGLKKGISLPPQRNIQIKALSYLKILLWTTVQQFMEKLEYDRPTVINIIRDTENNYLLVKRWPYLPGDHDYSFVQGGINTGESVTDSGVRELKEEVGMNSQFVDLLESPIKANREPIQVSFIRFLGLGAKFTHMKNYLCFGGYSGKKDELKVNWENKTLKWVDGESVHRHLSPDKLVIWNRIYPSIKKKD